MNCQQRISKLLRYPFTSGSSVCLFNTQFHLIFSQLITLLYRQQITGGRGNNLHEVETSTGEKYLASMPTKFRKNIWIKRGQYLERLFIRSSYLQMFCCFTSLGCYVVVEPIEEGKKVKAEIVQMLLKDQIKYFKSEGKW